MSQADYLLKFLVVGNAGVGKTCILHSYVHDSFKEDSQHTIGAELGSRIVSLKKEGQETEQLIKLQIWDTAGQERFRSVTRSYYRGACGALLVYDITDRQSFTAVASWLSDAKSLASSHIIIILCGNKSDLENERQVTTAEAESFAQENGMIFFETSAKDGVNVEEAFYTCTKTVISKIDNGTIDLNEPGTGILRYGAVRNQGSPSKTASGNTPRSEIDAKIDLLKRETEEAISKFKGSACCQ